MQCVFQAASVLVLIAYLSLAGSIGVNALIHRKAGWVSAVMFSLMLLSLPIWVGLMYAVFLFVSGAATE